MGAEIYLRSDRKNQSGRAISPFRLWVWLFIVWMLAAIEGSTTAQSPIVSGYGRTRGSEYAQSVNGTSLLKAYLEHEGFAVDVKQTITPRIEQYDVVIWAPNSNNPPRDEVVDRLESWLSAGAYRRLIYVGRDYDAAEEYWKFVIAQTSGEAREIALRELSELRKADEVWLVPISTDNECAWFRIDDAKPGIRQARTMFEVDSEEGDQSEEWFTGEVVWGEKMLIPNTTWRYQVNDLIVDRDGQVFAFELSREYSYGGKVVIVNNGSLLLNYALAQPQRRELAQQLLVDAGLDDPEYQRVLILESGPGDPPIRNSDTNDAKLAWVGEAPLKYIVPQLVVLGVIYCFVIFPILGRPRRLRTNTESRFGSHLEALGKWWSKNGRLDEPREVIERYRSMQDNV